MSGFEHLGMGLGGLGMILLWLVPVLLVLLLFRQRTGEHRADGNRAGGGGTERALEILKARYARGEIDQEEYRKRRADLET